MTRNRYLKFSFIAMIIVASACLCRLSAGHGAYPQTDLTLPGQEEQMQEGEGDPYLDSLVSRAQQSYKDVIFLHADGEDNSVIYPAMYECYLLNAEALKALEPGSDAWNQCRGTLIEINPDLEKAAFYYSGKGNQAELTKFAQAYIDTQLFDEMEGVQWRRNEQAFPSLTYIAAVPAYNNKEWDRAIKYFKLYFNTGDDKYRERVFLFMGLACFNDKQYELGISTLKDGLKQYPLNKDIMMTGIQSCVDGGHAESLDDFLAPALVMMPDDEQLLSLQGQLYEDRNQYRQALDIYTKLDQVSPNKLSVAKHIALCYYNLAVIYFNDAVISTDEKTQRKNNRMAKDYFGSAAIKLEEVLASDPMAVRYLRALGVSYLCLEDKERFSDINRKLQALGEDALSEVFSVPPMMAYNDEGGPNIRAAQDVVVGKGQAANAPSYSSFAQDYIQKALKKWSTKNEFEKIEDFNARVNQNTIRAEYERLNKEAQTAYIEKYSKSLRLSDLKLMPYDANNETFLIESSYGPITVKVPNKNNEAAQFKSNWEAMKFQSPKYLIADDKVQIAAINVVAPYGKTYAYDDSKAPRYVIHDININWEDFVPATPNPTPAGKTNVASVNIAGKSDVDENVPRTSKKADKTFALIIANENYESVAPVPMASHDGERFAEYCNKTLGIPESNIAFFNNITYAKMLGAIKQLKNTVNSFDGDAEVIFYYAGHGVPDDATKNAYLMPVDGDATMIAETGYSLDKLYNELGSLNSPSVMVFLDACFSGSNRDGKALNPNARGVAIASKDAGPQGNMFILSAASGQETAMPYKEMHHGLFTYFLLKKLQETKGNVTLKDLADYVTTNVKQTSNTKNHKMQTPTVATSGSMSQLWNKKKLVP